MTGILGAKHLREMTRVVIGTLRSVGALLFLVVTIPIAALIAFPWTFITGKAGFLYWLGMRLAYSGPRFAGARVKIVGLDKIDPSGTYIFMSNHVSNLDPLILCPLIPGRTSILAKKAIWRIPILGKALDLAEIVPVERENRESAIQSIRRAGEVMRHHIHVTLFPEGTRSRDGRLLPFKKGPFHLAGETGFPVVPVTILGTYEMMPKGQAIVRSGTATLVFHSPIDPKQFPTREELTQAVWSAINSALPPQRQ
ncbi:MAG TPA: lysophospholipid acyltransferase family protein [Candidatus Angelobacter sp.]|nr:lysophospholipid acyltransferase family protein [Candidatus Angelobacter sp.]